MITRLQKLLLAAIATGLLSASQASATEVFVLMSHPAYEEFRKLRAKLKAEGKPLTSLALADGLIHYSERGQEYVDTLKGIIRVNKLDVADSAVFRDEPLRLLVGATDSEAAAALRVEIEELRASGTLDDIIARMRLE
jgi:ABC-type amino acid transport substrate-binding protein